MKYRILFIALVLTACGGNQERTPLAPSAKYAKGFNVVNHGAYRDVIVRHATDSTIAPLRYRLVERGQPLPKPEENITVIEVPIASIVCTSTTHIPHLDYLGETKKLVGFPSLDYLSSPTMRAHIKDGKVEELGKENGLNLERLATLNPSVVMAYNMGKDLGQIKKVQELGIPVVVNADFLEQHPLGRAEWIKFTALFFKKEKQADSIFRSIESEYLTIKKSADYIQVKPTIMTGIPYGGIWYLPGGKNYAARFFEDAGCSYLWSDSPSSGFLELSLEAVYEKALNADYWIGVASFTTYEELQTADARFADFVPFKNKRIFHYNGSMGATGGNEYFELAYLRPDLLLKDLVQITHPEAYPNPALYFYRPLR